MHEDRRAERRALALRRNLLWPGILVLVTAIIAGVVWATSRPPPRGRR